LRLLEIFGLSDCDLGSVIHRWVERLELNKTYKIILLGNDESIKWLTLARVGWIGIATCFKSNSLQFAKPNPPR
jgi:hypothetical protein